jgi:hypothetical protein
MENLMNAPVLASARAESVSVDVEAEAALVAKKNPKPLSQIEIDAERVRSSIVRLSEYPQS